MNTNNIPTACNNLVPLQLLASQYGYAALLDADGNELPITEYMIQHACEEALDGLHPFLSQAGQSQAGKTPQENIAPEQP